MGNLFVVYPEIGNYCWHGMECRVSRCKSDSYDIKIHGTPCIIRDRNISHDNVTYVTTKRNLCSIYKHLRVRDANESVDNIIIKKSRWRHEMETFSALLVICAGNSSVPGEFPTQRPETRSFDVFFGLCRNKRLSKQSRGWWFETLSRPLWRHRNGREYVYGMWR